MNSTQQLTWYIKNNVPCMFLKYGDGEYYAANFYDGANCDGTPYTPLLGKKVRESFVYNTQQANAMIGAWHDTSNRVFWEGLGNPNVNWVDYHTVILDHISLGNNDKLELFRAIKESSRKKIYVANAAMSRAQPIFSIETFIDIDPSDWFETEYESVLTSVKNECTDNTLVLVSAGMGAKQLISDLHRAVPTAIYIDVGSAFDTLCTKRQTRTCSPPYEDICDYLRPVLPVLYN